MTPHISAKIGEIAKNVIMPGCPLRAKIFAEKYLQAPKLVNTIRNMYMFTGTYKGKPLSICASGMGYSSIGVYSHELYNFYGVDTIIRVGTCGSYKENVNVGDIFLVTEAYGEKEYSEILTDQSNDLAYPTPELVNQLEQSANSLGLKYQKGRCHSTSIFYHTKPVQYLVETSKADCVEMEAYPLFVNAKLANKQAAAILTVSDHLIKDDNVSGEERESICDDAIMVVLGMF